MYKSTAEFVFHKAYAMNESDSQDYSEFLQRNIQLAQNRYRAFLLPLLEHKQGVSVVNNSCDITTVKLTVRIIFDALSVLHFGQVIESNNDVSPMNLIFCKVVFPTVLNFLYRPYMKTFCFAAIVRLFRWARAMIWTATTRTMTRPRTH